jgi:hypothetical protein
MADETTVGSQTPSSEALVPAANFFSVGSELLNEVQRIIGHSRVRALRLTLGGRPIKEFPIAPVTAIATILVVVAAVVLSNLKIEVVKDPASSNGGAS